MKFFKKFKNVSLKIGLLLSAAGAFIALCTFNVILGLSDYAKTPIVFTLEALADGEGSGSENSGSSVSCLVNENPLINSRNKYASEMGSSIYCYKKRAVGPDLYQGQILGCAPNNNNNSSCTAKTCTKSGCYVSNQAPASDNY